MPGQPQQARAALERKDFETSYNMLTRTQHIVLELNRSLNHKEDPELCGKLAALERAGVRTAFQDAIDAVIGEDRERVTRRGTRR